VPLHHVSTEVGVSLRDVKEPAKIQIRRIRILYCKSVGLWCVTLRA